MDLLQSLSTSIVGVKMYLNKTYGPLQLQSLDDWKKVNVYYILCLSSIIKIM